MQKLIDMPFLRQGKHFQRLRKYIDTFFASLREFSRFFFGYGQKKVLFCSVHFEKQKNVLVRFFMMKRGRYNRPFLHVMAMVVLAFGVLLGPFLADTYPVFSQDSNLTLQADAASTEQSITPDNDVFQTAISAKPRDKTLTYKVEPGDTLSTIAEKFGVSTDTIRWANDLTNDSLTVGDMLQILPVTGVAHKVQSGETIYSIAKKYSSQPQQIVDFPFNDFANPETFSLVVGQVLIVPDGVMPSAAPSAPLRRQVYIAQGPVSVTNAGFTWPVHGEISQFASWYHTALDITSSIGTPVVAAQSGHVIKASVGTWDGGYGTNVMIDNGQGFSTLYGHMSGINVGVGDEVTAGKSVIGWVGMTGRTTGPHVHFEIRRGGVLADPLPYLQ